MSQDSSYRTKERRILTGNDYIESLRGRELAVYLFGELVAERLGDRDVVATSFAIQGYRQRQKAAEAES